jgi:hypothetical protein
MKRTLAIAIGAVVAFGSMLGLAGADRKAITDPSGDSPDPAFDIVRAKAKHGPKNRLVHTVKMADPIASDLTNKRISLQISTDRDSDCELEFHVPPIGSNPLIRCGIGETNRSGTVTKPNARTIKYTFKERVIGSPRKYRWRMSTSDCPGGPGTCVDYDVAPGAERYVTHKLD